MQISPPPLQASTSASAPPTRPMNPGTVTILATAAAAGTILFGTVALLTMTEGGARGGASTLLGVGAVLPWGLPLAVVNARLPPAGRHFYNLHFLVLLPLALFTWTLPFSGAVGELLPQSLHGFADGLLIGTAAATLACLLCSASAVKEVRQAAALGAASLVLALANRAALWPLVPALAFAAALRLPKDMAFQAAIEKPREGRLAAMGTLSFLGLSVLCLTGLLQPVVGLVLPLFRGEGSPWGADGMPPESLLMAVITRLCVATLGAIVAGAAALRWPHRRVSRGAVGLALFCLALAPLAVAPWRGFASLGTIFVGLALLAAGTSVLMAIPAERRGPAAVAAAGVGGLIGFELVRPALPDAALGWVLLAWVVEAVALLVLWALAYLIGLRALRAWSESNPEREST